MGVVVEQWWALVVFGRCCDWLWVFMLEGEGRKAPCWQARKRTRTTCDRLGKFGEAAALLAQLRPAGGKAAKSRRTIDMLGEVLVYGVLVNQGCKCRGCVVGVIRVRLGGVVSAGQDLRQSSECGHGGGSPEHADEGLRGRGRGGRCVGHVVQGFS